MDIFEKLELAKEIAYQQRINNRSDLDAQSSGCAAAFFGIVTLIGVVAFGIPYLIFPTQIKDYFKITGDSRIEEKEHQQKIIASIKAEGNKKRPRLLSVKFQQKDYYNDPQRDILIKVQSKSYVYAWCLCDDTQNQGYFRMKKRIKKDQISLQFGPINCCLRDSVTIAVSHSYFFNPKETLLVTVPVPSYKVKEKPRYSPPQTNRYPSTTMDSGRPIIGNRSSSVSGGTPPGY